MSQSKEPAIRQDHYDTLKACVSDVLHRTFPNLSMSPAQAWLDRAARRRYGPFAATKKIAARPALFEAWYATIEALASEGRLDPLLWETAPNGARTSGYYSDAQIIRAMRRIFKEMGAQV